MSTRAGLDAAARKKNDFLSRFDSPDSPTRGDAYQSARAAGYNNEWAIRLENEVTEVRIGPEPSEQGQYAGPRGGKLRKIIPQLIVKVSALAWKRMVGAPNRKRPVQPETPEAAQARLDAALPAPARRAAKRAEKLERESAVRIRFSRAYDQQGLHPDEATAWFRDAPAPYGTVAVLDLTSTTALEQRVRNSRWNLANSYVQKFPLRASQD